ncbi:hypothetical protein REC12_17345 [Desulfosporosinus sp. PR]|nr:hypothetical protein [Desulfosporosinus sp. PR]MDQ7095358.1 hypothetical protein [Desulfosporosinus sp. PR]
MMRSQENTKPFEDQKVPEKMCVRIQNEEEQHGEDLINYLYSKGAYPIQ